MVTLKLKGSAENRIYAEIKKPKKNPSVQSTQMAVHEKEKQ